MVCKVPKCLCPSSVLCGRHAILYRAEGDINACLPLILLLPISVSWIREGSEWQQQLLRDTVTSSMLYIGNDITCDVMNRQFHIREPTAKNG